MTNLARLQKRAINGIAFDIEPLLRELRAFGEPAVAEWLSAVDACTHDEVSRKALAYLQSENTFADKAICLAAVETMEGHLRPLRRQRRCYRGL